MQFVLSSLLNVPLDQPAEVREEEGIDPARLLPFLRSALPEATGPVSVLQFPKGHSNLTYLVRVGEREVVRAGAEVP